MLNQFLEFINEKSIAFKKFLVDNSSFFVKFVYVFLLSVALIIAFEINFVFLNNFLFVPLNNSDNTFYLILKGGLLYLICIIGGIRLVFINFIFSLPIFLLYDGFFHSIYSFILNYEYLLKFNKFKSLQSFYDFFSFGNELSYNFFHYDYLRTKRFIKLILINSNLPVFFYFFVLFVLTTILSLFLLSYLGLYGVFFLNLITIFMF